MNKMYGINSAWGAGAGFGREDIQKIKQMGFNTVRAAFIYWGILMPTDEFTINDSVFTTSIGPSGTVGLDQYVDWYEAEGMNIILTLAWTPWYKPPAWAFPGVTELYDRCEILFTPGTREQIGWINAWKALADRYKDRPHVMFEIINEPGINDKASAYPEAYKVFMEELTDGIRATETIPHWNIVPMLRAGAGWEEVVDEQPDINRPNIMWGTHRYTPWGDYDPNELKWGYDYETGKTGWIPAHKYVYWRIRRCADKIHSWGKPWMNTEFGKGIDMQNWALYLDYILTLMEELGIDGWAFHSYNRSGENFSIVDAAGNIRTQILDVLAPHMEPTPPPEPPTPPIDLPAIGGIALAIADAALITYAAAVFLGLI